MKIKNFISMNFGFRFVIAVLMAITLCACDKPSQKQHKAKEKMQIDSQLLKIDMDLAMLEMDLRTSQTVDCMIANSMKNLEAKNKIIDEMKASAANNCAVSNALVNSTKDIFTKLKSEGSVGYPLYLFTVFKSEGETNKEQRAGVFSTLEQCTELEKQVHDMGVPTSKCKEWKSLLKPLDDSVSVKK